MVATSKSAHPKILDLERLAQVIAAFRAQGKKVVQCHGVFDLMHIGHIRHFEQARKLGDVLVVTVTPDRYVNKGPNRPVFTDAHRAWSIAALGCVDYVAINEWPMAVDTIRLLRPSIFVKGSEYRDAAKDQTGAISVEEQAVREAGGELRFTEDIVFSSSNLLNRHFGIFPETTQDFLTSFAARHDADEIVRYVHQTSALKTLVIGEAIIDEYHYCETIGKSGKEPVLVARHTSSERFPGGILAVANHTSGLCDRVTMLTSLGAADSQEEFVRERTNTDVQKLFLYQPNVPTMVKRRFLESYPFQKLFEVYVMGDADESDAHSYELCAKLSEILPEYDAVIIADYGHGLITHEAADILSRHARFLAINTQVNAGNHGFNTISKYPRADYICISEREVRLDARSRTRDLREIVIELSQKLGCAQIVITRGQLGCLCFSKSEGFCEIPAFTGQVVDRIGAGDAVLAITSLFAAQGVPMDVIGFIGSCTGAQAVGVVANRSSVERVPLIRYIECLLK
jgi:rfaE bifunctional protein nucleotidyltransferase chain/domain